MPEACRLLYVDDEEFMLTCMVETFQTVDLEIVTARSGPEGLQQLQANDSILVVMSDYRMPGMNGIEFLGKVAARFPSTVRILFSGYAEQDEIEAALIDGTVTHFIRKPWEIASLVSLIRDALDNNNSADSIISHHLKFIPAAADNNQQGSTSYATMHEGGRH